MIDGEIRKLALEKEIQQKTVTVMNLTNKIAKQTIDNRSGSIYQQSVSTLSQEQKELEKLSTEYTKLLKGMYKR